MLLRMLHGYMEIFSDMLKKANSIVTKNSLKKLQEGVKQLKDKYKEEQAVWKKIHEIDSLQVKKKKNFTLLSFRLNYTFEHLEFHFMGIFS